MSRRTDVLRLLLQSDEFVEEKGNEQQFLLANAKLIMTDLLSIATHNIQSRGVGTLLVNLVADSTTYFALDEVKDELAAAMDTMDTNDIDFLAPLISDINVNDWSKNVLITMISDDMTKTYPISKEF